MATTIERLQQVPVMLAAPRAVTLVSVPWSPWPRKSREVLAELERTRGLWSPGTEVEFFDLWPERDGELNAWYDRTCRDYSPGFELHGHGYGPLWWLSRGVVIGCLTEPYEERLPDLQKYSADLLNTASGPFGAEDV